MNTPNDEVALYSRRATCRPLFESMQKLSRHTRPEIILAVGLPGCGKSTFLARLNVHPVSSDAIRLQLADDERDQTIHERVFATVRYMVRQRIEIGRAVTYVDATHLTRRDRLPYFNLAREYGCAVEALWFDIPSPVCKARNAARGRVVPEHGMDLMAARFIPPSMAEGFSAIKRVE